MKVGSHLIWVGNYKVRQNAVEQTLQTSRTTIPKLTGACRRPVGMEKSSILIPFPVKLRPQGLETLKSISRITQTRRVLLNVHYNVP